MTKCLLSRRSFSRLTAFEASRILTRLGADVRVYDPFELPVKGACPESHEKVAELRSLSDWSDAHFWVSPEQHGTITAVMKNQIDWIPLSTGSVRPTQGRTLAIAQVNGGWVSSLVPVSLSLSSLTVLEHAQESELQHRQRPPSARTMDAHVHGEPHARSAPSIPPRLTRLAPRHPSRTDPEPVLDPESLDPIHRNGPAPAVLEPGPPRRRLRGADQSDARPPAAL